MSEEATAEIDVLEILERNVERLIAGLKESGRDTGYVEGQLAYLTALYPQLDDVPSDVRPRDLLDDVARELGVEMDQGRIDPTPESQRELGVLSMWSLCLGFSEGAAMGVQTAMNVVDSAEGVHASAHE